MKKKRSSRYTKHIALIAAVTVIGLASTPVAQPLSAAQPPAGKTYFTAFFGLEDAYAIGVSCFVFEESGFCTHDGLTCGSWLRTGVSGREAGFSFDLSFFDDGVPVRLSGEARVDALGDRSSVAGTGLVQRDNSRANFSFAGRAASLERCVEELAEAPGGDSVPIEGSGIVVSESRDVSDFHAVTVAGVGRVVIEHGTTPSLRVTADDNLIEHLTSEVRDGRLFLAIDPAVRIRTGNNILYEITIVALDGITASGVVGVEARGVATDLLTVAVVGVAGVTVQGTAERQHVTLQGVSVYDARELESRFATVDISGVSAATVRVSEELEGVVTGPSTLDYIGNPVVAVTATGGAVVRRIGG